MELFWKRKVKPHKEEDQHVDYSSLFASMSQGQKLFNQLKVQCHPDRFVGTDKQALAEELFKQVQENSTDLEKLLALKERILTEL